MHDKCTLLLLERQADRHRETGRQKQKGIQTHRKTGRQADTERPVDRHRETDRQTSGQILRDQRTDTETDRQTSRQILRDRWTDTERQTGRQADRY